MKYKIAMQNSKTKISESQEKNTLENYTFLDNRDSSMTGKWAGSVNSNPVTNLVN